MRLGRGGRKKEIKYSWCAYIYFGPLKAFNLSVKMRVWKYIVSLTFFFFLFFLFFLAFFRQSTAYCLYNLHNPCTMYNLSDCYLQRWWMNGGVKCKMDVNVGVSCIFSSYNPLSTVSFLVSAHPFCFLYRYWYSCGLVYSICKEYIPCLVRVKC